MTTDDSADPQMLHRVHLLLTKMLAEFDRVCRQLGVSYAVYGGTAIGAVVGTIGGLLAGLFSKKKNKVTDDLMKVFPGLVDEAGASADAGGLCRGWEVCRVHDQKSI